MKPDRLTRLGLLLALFVSCVGCDQVTKSIAARALAALPRQSFLGDTVRLEYALNPGAFLGMGGDLSSGARFWGLTVINGALLAVLAYVLITRWDMAPGNFAAWALILAGGVGNLIDRVSQHGLVTDFLNVGIGPIRTGIFNVADVSVTAGFALFLVVWWREERVARGSAPQTASPDPHNPSLPRGKNRRLAPTAGRSAGRGAEAEAASSSRDTCTRTSARGSPAAGPRPSSR